MKLRDKTVLVTGGSKGIGKATVEAMVREGANIVLTYATDQDVENYAQDLSVQFGVRIRAIQTDITNQAEVDAMFSKVKNEFSGLDVVVNSAGIFDDHDSPENLEAFRGIFETNFLGQVRITNGARKLMTKGKIVFVSSLSGGYGQGSPDSIAYAAMKAALDSYTRNLARALAPNILVNAIAPGATLTPMWGEMDPSYKAKVASGLLIGRWIQSSEIAEGIVFLAKNDAICGEVLVLDGGDGLKQ